MMKRLILLLVVISVLALSGCARLVFVRGRDAETPQLYTIGADGTAEANLSQSEFNSSYPDPSRDGATMAFSSGNIAAGAVDNIFLMPANGGPRSQLTTGAFQKWSPRWGLGAYADRIVYSEYGAASTGRLYVVSAAGAVQQLTNPGPDFSDRFPAIYFSEVGSQYKVVFSRMHVATGRARLYTMNLDGSGETGMVTKDLRDDEDMPVVSHDGRFIAYRARPVAPESFAEAVRVITANDRQRVAEFRLPFPDLMNIRGIGWSRSDRKLYVAMETSEVTAVQFTEDRSEIFSMKPDGSGLRRLTRNTVPDYWPSGVPCAQWRTICALADLFRGD